MQVHHYIDSITIQVINLPSYQDEIIHFYNMHQLKLIEANMLSNNGIYKPDIIVFENDTRHPIIYSYHNGSMDDTQYTTFKFVGLKSYNDKRDKKKLKILNKFISFLIETDIEYRLKTLELAFDFEVNKSIKNFFPIRINKQGMKNKINNPFDYYESTTLYVEDKSVKKPSLKAYVYDKSVKENLNTKIIRFEVCIRNIKTELNNFDSMIKHIQTQLAKYQLYFFSSIAECNDAKWLYKKGYKISRKMEKFLSSSNAQEVPLVIANDIYNFLANFYYMQIKR